MGKGISRRTLITGGAIAAMGAAVAAVTGGCAAQSESNAHEKKSALGNYPVHVHETDVLVVGGGYAGCMAAYRALQLGCKVTILDKGVFAHSGTSGYNWGSMYTCYDMSNDMESSYKSALMGKIRAASGVCDQNVTNALISEMLQMRPTLLMESLGAFHERLEDGTPGTCVMGTPNIAETSRTIAGMYGRFLCHKVKRMGADVCDRTMLVDLLTDGQGEAAGGIALNLRTGDAEIYRAKSVVMATGSYNWLCGWTGWRPQSMIGPECTGDGFSIMMSNGVPVGNFEFVCTDFDAYNPGCLRDTFTIGLEYPDCERAVNSEGERFALEYLTEHPDQGGIETLTQLVAGEVYHGRGSEHGGVWLDTKDWSGQEMELFYRLTPEELKRNFGYELPEKVEVIPDHWCSGCQPKVGVDMQTVMPGLYFAGYASMSCDCTGIMASGSIAGYGSAQRALTGERSAIDWDKANSTLEHVYGILENDSKNALSAEEVMHRVQKAYASGLDMLRNESGIQASLDELRRIREEDVPAIVVKDKSRVCNLEWRHAIEAEYMLNCAIGVAMGALERRESRFHHVRTDFPAIDNSETYLKRFMISIEDDEFVLTPENVDMSVVDMESIGALIASTNINSREA